MRNGVSYPPWFREVHEERSQWVISSVGGGVTPVNLGVDHVALKPPPDDKGPADLRMQIVECWSEFAHLSRIHEYHF